MLKRVSIQNFKSLKDVTLDLQKVNLLIGPNNSGKSNFLKSLEFYYKSARNGIAVDKEFCYLKDSANTVSIKLSFKDKSQISDQYSHYTIKSYADFSERIQENFNYQFSISSSTELDGIEDRLDTGTTTESQRLSYKALTNRKFRGYIYKPDPNQLLNPVSLESDDYVNETGSNITSYLFNLSQNRRDIFSELEANFHQCVGDLERISTPVVRTENGNKLKLKFFDTYGHDYWVEEVSEGVLYFLTLLCIIHQPDPPKILLLEEPEKGIHPRRIEEIVNFIFSLSEEKDIQVIMTTHSPIVVDMFRDMPESVFIFDKYEGGATYVKNLQNDIIDPETAESERLGIDPPHYLNGLGQAWKVGLIGGIPR